MENLPLIPIPPSQRWREFRIQIVPFFVFFVTLAVVIYLWRENVSAPTLIGEVETIRAEVTSPDAGTITNLFVERFQMVHKGDPIAEIISTDSRNVDSRVQFLRGEIALSQFEFSTAVDRQRLDNDMRTEYFRHLVDLADTKARLEPAEKDYEVAKDLLNSKVFGQIEFDFFANAYAGLKARVDQLNLVTQDIEKRLEQNNLAPGGEIGSASKSMEIALRRLDAEKLRLTQLQTRPIVLTAPMDGIVSTVMRRAGENIIAGSPLVVISSPTSEKIVGYLRDPIPMTPEQGMEVRVRTRALKRQESWGKILGVGAQFETITNVALLRPGATMHEVGLPVAVSIPPALKGVLKPGQTVELFVRP